MSDVRKGPVVISLEEDVEQAVQSPADAPPVPEPDFPMSTPALETGVRFAAKRGSQVWTLFWAALGSLVLFMAGVFFWDFAAQMLARNVWLGRAALVLMILVGGALLIVAGRELATLSRLRRVDGLRAEAETLSQGGDLTAARAFQDKLERLYKGRADLRWGLAEVAERQEDVLDVEGALALAEVSLMRPLDAQAQEQVEAAARQVATATAIVPLAFADVIVALTANLRMIRQIAQIYGGRSGTFGNWRLTKAVASHLVATGAVAVGDDLIGSVAGGGVLSKISRRFGEGMINGALTARVGVAAMEVCRPMPFKAEPRPRVTVVVKQALTGLFGK